LGTREVARFEITAWEQKAYDEPGEGPTLSRATVGKNYSGGVLEGRSTAELLMSQAPGSNVYVALERVVGRLAGRSGTFVIRHGGLDIAGAPAVSQGIIVPGSGTGELAGLRGDVTFEHDEAGARAILEYHFG
jgi:hypothetical protein